MRTSKTVDETASTQDSSATQGELPRFEPYESPAGGWGALQAEAEALREQSIILNQLSWFASRTRPGSLRLTTFN
jgi:hypothetical protein